MCLSQDAVLKGAQLHRQSESFLVDIAPERLVSQRVGLRSILDESPCFLETAGRCLIAVPVGLSCGSQGFVQG